MDCISLMGSHLGTRCITVIQLLFGSGVYLDHIGDYVVHALHIDLTGTILLGGLLNGDIRIFEQWWIQGGATAAGTPPFHR